LTVRSTRLGHLSSRRRVLLLTWLLLFWLASPGTARADQLVIPHVGAVFGGTTTLIDLDRGAGSKSFTFGASAAWLSQKVFGVEADVAHTPHFFGSGNRSLILASSVTTATGNLIIAVPASVTRESLRPYLLAGVGLMHASSNDVVGIFSFDSNLWGLSLGGGAIGMLTPRSGVRFDLRQFRSLSPDDTASTTSGRARLSFWRATAGVVFKY
jgi:hypothetical protein